MKCSNCGNKSKKEFRFCPECGAPLLNATAVKQKNTKKRGNGQGSVYQLANGKYAAVVTLGYTVDNGILRRKTISKQFTKKTEAIQFLPELRKSFSHPKDMKIHDLHEIYEQSHDYDKLSASQKKKLGIAWTRLKEIEFFEIGKLTVDDLEKVINAQTNTYYPAKDMKTVLSHLYQIAIKKEIVEYNKALYIDLPDVPTPQLHCWTDEEVALFWEDYKMNPFTAYILIMCYAGLRYGELATQMLENIHLDDNYMVGGIKSDAGRNRDIPISNRIKPVIEKLLNSGKLKKKLLEMNEDNFYRQYWEVIHRLNVHEYPPQTCRHFFFSSLIRGSVNPSIVTKIGGHSDYSTTMRNYITIPLSDKINAVDTIK